ncbi:MAG: hypothetical protein KTV77_03035 [Wolbachia endosymbiont of Fragariocoptes setiger]|nr:hypothetical protein [Wolbachia endosymbiont of Fragariocoptes setiger]
MTYMFSQNEFGKFWIREFHYKRCLIFDEDSKYLESCIPINNSNYLGLSYSKDMISSLYIKNTSPKHVLMIGLGGGVIPTTLLKLFPDMKLDIVEIDHDVLNIAKQYFFFKPTENTNIFIEDALIYVNRNTTKRYDFS